MPHVTIQLYAGRSDQDKARLAQAVTQALIDALGSKPDAISVGVEDVTPEDWMGKVYEPEIVAKQDQLFKRPGYGPLK
jgi:4-oxalocrotonate tautomerase